MYSTVRQHLCEYESSTYHCPFAEAFQKADHEAFKRERKPIEIQQEPCALTRLYVCHFSCRVTNISPVIQPLPRLDDETTE